MCTAAWFQDAVCTILGYQLISNQSYLVPGALLSMCNYYPDIAKNIHVWSQNIAMYCTAAWCTGYCQVLTPCAKIEQSLYSCLVLRVLPSIYAQCTA
jgi:hypothetical protein